MSPPVAKYALQFLSRIGIDWPEIKSANQVKSALTNIVNGVETMPPDIAQLALKFLDRVGINWSELDAATQVQSALMEAANVDRQ